MTVQQLIDSLVLIKDKTQPCKLVLDEDIDALTEQQEENGGYIVVPLIQVYENDGVVQLQSFASL